MKSEKILYLECCSGISGDMTVAALLDLGADEGRLREALGSLPLAGYEIHISRVRKSGLDACDFAVQLDGAHENHDHDMAYLHGDLQAHPHSRDEGVHGHSHDGHAHDEGVHGYSHGGNVGDEGVHGHSHDGHAHDEGAHGYSHDGNVGDEGVHGHSHDEPPHDSHRHEREGCEQNAQHHHGHRGLREIHSIIEAGKLTSGAKQLAFRIFDILADAEAKAHGVPREQVHFHEVGAVDSIVDIVAAAVCLDDLAPERIVISPLSEGNGTVRCQHGILPIPVPAVANIVTEHGVPIHRTTVDGELVTPTGAAIAAAVMQTPGNILPDDYTVRGIGVGAGKRDYATAGILRAMWIEPARRDERCEPGDRIVRLEANIDDATGEELGHCMDCLMEAGARDVSFVPLYMKKNRPAYEVHVICAPQDVSRMEETLFRETTTIGVRRVQMERTVMERRLRQVETVYGTAHVKECCYGDIRKIYPEYESVVGLCRTSGEAFRKVYQTIVTSAEKEE